MWGRAILISAARHAAPAGYAGGSERSAARQIKARSTAAKQAARAARIARRHAKLDLHLNDAVEDAVNGESNVIIEFNDERDAVNLVKATAARPAAASASSRRASPRCRTAS